MCCLIPKKYKEILANRLIYKGNFPQEYQSMFLETKHKIPKMFKISVLLVDIRNQVIFLNM